MKQRLYIFDFIRALALCFVVFGHYLVHYHHYAETHESWIKIQAVGVGLYFFISGYLIFLSLTKSTLLGYCWHRFFRIVPALVVAMLFLAILNHHFSLKSFAFGLFFVGDFFHELGVYGIDMWTLHSEIRFYILAGLISFLFLNSEITKIRLLFAYITSVLALLLSILILNREYPGFQPAGPVYNVYCIFFIFYGVFFFFYHQEHIHLLAFILAIVINTSLILYLNITFTGHDLISALKDNMLLACLLAMSLCLLSKYVPKSKIVSFIAYISFPLYLIHHPIIFRWGLWGVPPLIAVSTLISVFIEYPIIAWSKKSIHLMLPPKV